MLFDGGGTDGGGGGGGGGLQWMSQSTPAGFVFGLEWAGSPTAWEGVPANVFKWWVPSSEPPPQPPQGWVCCWSVAGRP